MELVTTVLGGIVIAVVSGTVGKGIGTNDNVKASTCLERRTACDSLVTEKIDHLARKVDELTKAVNSKLLGM